MGSSPGRSSRVCGGDLVCERNQQRVKENNMTKKGVNKTKYTYTKYRREYKQQPESRAFHERQADRGQMRRGKASNKKVRKKAVRGSDAKATDRCVDASPVRGTRSHTPLDQLLQVDYSETKRRRRSVVQHCTERFVSRKLSARFLKRHRYRHCHSCCCGVDKPSKSVQGVRYLTLSAVKRKQEGWALSLLAETRGMRS